MIRRIPTNVIPSRLSRISFTRRYFSIRAIYSSFPATLFYYSPSHRSSLYDYKDIDSRPDYIFDEAVRMESDGLVYPNTTTEKEIVSVSNGAVMYPNTFMMQELIRQCYDDNLNLKDEGKEVETPHIYGIPKGTPIPSNLTLIHEYIARFSLRPSRGMTPNDLNRSLDEFYKTYAIKKTAGEWLNGHPYEGAMEDDAEEIWMAT